MRSAFIVLKLLYLYLQYFVIGLTEDGFQIQKGHYLCELGQYAAAAKAYELALRDTHSAWVVGALGYCYLCMQITDRAVEYLRQAYTRRSDPELGVTLLQALWQNGDTSEAESLYVLLKQEATKLSRDAQAALQAYEAARGEQPKVQPATEQVAT